MVNQDPFDHKWGNTQEPNPNPTPNLHFNLNVILNLNPNPHPHPTLHPNPHPNPNPYPNPHPNTKATPSPLGVLNTQDTKQSKSNTTVKYRNTQSKLNTETNRVN